MMKNRKRILVSTLVVLLASGTSVFADDPLVIDVQISPSTIVLTLDHGSSVTVHTDIAYSTVDRQTVSLEGIPATLTKADSCGNLVAKFAQQAIEDIVSPPEVTLMLTGSTQDGVAFYGVDCVRVINDPSPARASFLDKLVATRAPSGRQGGQQALTAAEEEHILHMREEEKLARDVYMALYEVWGASIFANISESEQRHMDAVASLIETSGLEDPAADDTPGVFTSPVFTEMYDQLMEQGSASLVDALTVGAFIEDLDIVDLRVALVEADSASVQRVFENLEAGSCNHLRAFCGSLALYEETYAAEFLTQEAFDAILADGDTGGSQNGGSGNRPAGQNGQGAQGGSRPSAVRWP